MDCCDEAGCADQAFRELTDEEILALDFDPDFDRFLVDLQRQEEIPGLSLANVLDDAAAEDSLPFVAEGSTGENRSDSFPRSPPESVDNDSCHISGSAACQWHGHGLSFEEECHRVGTQQDSSLRLFQQDSSEETRSQRVKERNRLYAARTRQRKTRMMQDLRQRCQDLEAENYELRARVVDLEARLASSYENGSLRIQEMLPADVPGTCSPQTSDGSVRPQMPARPPAPNSNALHLHRGQQSHTKAANKLRFTAAAASRRGHVDAKASPASTTSGGSMSPELLWHTPCQNCRPSGHSGSQSTWCSSHGTTSAVSESAEQPLTAMPADSTRRKRSHAEPFTSPVPTAKNRRFLSFASPGRNPVQGFVTSGMMVLVAMSCLILIAIPALHVLSPVRSHHPEWSGAARVPRQVSSNDHMHGRALLSASPVDHDSLAVSAIATLGDAGVMQYASAWHEDHAGSGDPWLVASDDAELILESAAFVCNHSACVAIPVDGAWADVVPLQPLELRPEQPGDRSTLDEAVFSTLKAVTPVTETDRVPAQFLPTASLRGGGFVGDRTDEHEEDCGGSSCFSFQHIAGKALNMAGLMAPEMCELVHRTTYGGGVTGSGDVVSEQPAAQPGTQATALAHAGYGTGNMVPKSIAARGQAPRHDHRQAYGSNHVENSTGQGGPGDFLNDQTLSVLFPVWAHDAEDDSALTPIRHMYVFVLEQEDLLTYQCSMSRPMYM